MRGGYIQRGRGGIFIPNHNFGNDGGVSGSPSDTLSIRITEIHQPVTEEVMRRVFDKVGAAIQNIVISPSNSRSEANVVVRFVDTFSAERVMSSLNNRNIFNNANKMSMTYMPSSADIMLGGEMNRGNNAVLALPTEAYGGAQGMGMFHQPQPLPYPSTSLLMPNGGPNANSIMGMSFLPNPSLPPRGGYGPISDSSAAPYTPYPPPTGPNAYHAPPHGGMRGGGGGRRGAGRGRGGGALEAGGAGFNPMGAPSSMGMPPFLGLMPFPGGPLMGGPGMPFVAPVPASTVYLSVTVVPMTEPLQSIFVLIEAYGGVVSMRRNQKQKEILTVKMATPADADAVTRFLHRIPFAGGTVSAKKFPTYIERNPCTDDGDPLDPETTQFDFTAARHRSPGQRSTHAPTNFVKITGCANYTESDLMTYFNSQNFFPENISTDSEGVFWVHMSDTETVVKLLITCHGNVCGEERSNVIFVDAPK
ncbi:unnamed protein product [Phytomonas sp. EM1]|nr:unnamed protein product [Phytomonas sp. EM1]|eukprot:CCW62751.1 unnamed protein product [Phytomonas sp. isolate EM1]